MSEAGALWTEDGQVCAKCEEREILASSFLKAYRSSALASLVLGLVALLLIDPFFAFTLLGASSAGCAFKNTRTRDALERTVAREHRGLLVVTILGVVCLSVHVARIVFGFSAAL